MKNIFKGLGIGLFALALVVGVGAVNVEAALTVTNVAVDTAATDAFVLGASNTTGSITIGSATHTGSTTISSGTVTGTTTTSAVPIIADGVTTGTAVYLTVDALTSGEGILVDHDSTVIADGGSLLRLDSSTADTGGATNGTLLDIQSSAQLAGVIARVDNILTTGSALTIVGTGIMTGAGNLATLTANSATTAAGLLRINGNGLTSGIGQVITSSSTGLTGAGRLLRVDHTGNAGDASGVVAEVASAAADETTIFRVTGSAALAAGVALDVSAAALTTGTVLDMGGLAAITTGKGINLAASGTTRTDGILVNVTDASTAATATGRMFYSGHTGATGDSTILNEFASAANDETVVLRVTASDVLAAGNIVDISGAAMTTGTALDIGGLAAITTGNGIVVAASSTTRTDGLLVSITDASTAATATGRMLNVSHTGVSGTSTIVAEIKSAAADETEVLKVLGSAAITGPVLNVVANSATGNAGVARISATALTSGDGLLITGSAPGTMTNAGRFLRIADDTTNVFGIGENGHIKQAQAAAPTGTTGTCTDDSVSASSTDTHGEITATCNNQTAIVAFNIAYAAAPHCVVTPMNAAANANAATAGFSYVTATTGITITQTANVTAVVYAYMCME